MDYVTAILSNHYVTVPVLAWFVAQVVKVFSTLLVYHKLDMRRLIGAGGMPSSHTAYIVCLAAVIGKNIGLTSAEFGITVCFSFIVMYDALGVRRAAGRQARLLNQLMSAHFPDAAFYETLKELLGHKPLEVVVGAVFGIAFGVLLG